MGSFSLLQLRGGGYLAWAGRWTWEVSEPVLQSRGFVSPVSQRQCGKKSGGRTVTVLAWGASSRTRTTGAKGAAKAVSLPARVFPSAVL
jgi:hypothetical protein